MAVIVRRRLTETQRPAEGRWVGEGDYSDVDEHRWVGAGNMLWRKDDSWLREQNRNRETTREKTGIYSFVYVLPYSIKLASITCLGN